SFIRCIHLDPVHCPPCRPPLWYSPPKDCAHVPPNMRATPYLRVTINLCLVSCEYNMQATGRIGTTPSSGSNSRLLIAEHSSGVGPSGSEHDCTAYIPRYKTKLVSFTLSQSWRRKWSMLLLPNHFPGSRYFISSITSGQYDGSA